MDFDRKGVGTGTVQGENKPAPEGVLVFPDLPVLSFFRVACHDLSVSKQVDTFVTCKFDPKTALAQFSWTEGTKSQTSFLNKNYYG
ncbi:hypothetical protein MRBLMN1_005201 [Chitinophaga ginsengisegetis]|uniref:hypothetical protein n=1 Tax=Chitinophaga ginsengisegetis TaxID=393003 RepID=UPI0034316B55